MRNNITFGKQWPNSLQRDQTLEFILEQLFVLDGYKVHFTSFRFYSVSCEGEIRINGEPFRLKLDFEFGIQHDVAMILFIKKALIMYDKKASTRKVLFDKFKKKAAKK